MLKCKLCTEINAAASEVEGVAVALKKLSKEISPIVERYESLRHAHPRCSLCTIYAGRAHLEVTLIPEPVIPRAKGQKRYDVCSDCYEIIKKTRMSVPQRRKYQMHIEEVLESEAEQADLVEEHGA
jgi:hypothetical protein